MTNKESLWAQLIEMRSRPKSLCTILQRPWKIRVNTANIDSLHQLHVIVNKSLWHLWHACNYTSVFHSNIWQKCLKTLKQHTLWTFNICVILKTFCHDCTPSTTPVHWTGQTRLNSFQALGHTPLVPTRIGRTRWGRTPIACTGPLPATVPGACLSSVWNR